MPNLRIVSRNLADRATLTASSEASADTAVANLKTNKKGDVWRATKTYAAIKAVLAEQATVGFVGLAFGNLSDSALVRRRVSNEGAATNLFTYSEGGASTLSSSSGVATAGETFGNFVQALQFQSQSSVNAWAYRYVTLAAGTEVVLSVFVKMDDGGVAVVSSSQTSGDFSLVVDGARLGGTVEDMGGGIYRVWTTRTSLAASTSHGVVKYTTQSTRGFRVTGYMLTVGSTLTSYYPSADTFTSRASTATYIGSDGLIKTAAINEARWQYNPDDLNAPPKLLFEAAATNVLKGSETFSAANGWNGTASVAAASQNYKGVPYQKIAKTTTSANEGRTISIGAVAAGQVWTETFALRADTSSAVGIGLYDDSGSAWGRSGESVASIISGPGTIALAGGYNGLYNVTGLSTTQDTLIQVTRLFVSAGSGRVYIYPGTPASTAIGDAILATRAQVEAAQVAYGAEKVANGTFDSNTAGWASSPTLASTASAVAGEMQVSTTTAGGRQLQAVTLTVGKTYMLTGTARRVSGDGAAAVGYSTNSNGTGLVSVMTNTSATAVTGSITFTATQSTYYICAGDGVGSATNATYAFDNISVKEFTLIPVTTSYIPTTNAAVTRAADVSTSAAGVRPAGYIDYWQSYDYDSGWVSARTIKAELAGFTDAQAASAYAYGGGSYSPHWLTKMLARGVSVDIKDTGNLQGYIEASRLVIGDYWEPQYNADYGASVTPVDTSKHTRTESGDLSTDIGTKHRKLSLQLSHLTPTDRATLFRILRSSGMAHPVWLSVFPEHADVQLEHDHQIFGALANTAAMSIPGFERYQSTLELEEI